MESSSSQLARRPLKLFGAGADSGTFDYFTEAIAGKAKSSRGDFTASEDDNVLVQGVANDHNALGFFGFAYYAENKGKLKAVAIDNGKGPVGPSEKTVLDGTYQPLSRPIYIYVSKKSLAKPEVKEFVEYYLKHAPKLVREVKYVPLPQIKPIRLGASHVKKRQSRNGIRRQARKSESPSKTSEARAETLAGVNDRRDGAHSGAPSRVSAERSDPHQVREEKTM